MFTTCRERTQASDFNAALIDHLQYLRRQKEAARMKAEYAAVATDGAQNGGSSNGGGSGTVGGPARDLALKPGETIKVALRTSRVRSAEVLGVPDVPFLHDACSTGGA